MKPQFVLKKIADEGTASPFFARLFAQIAGLSQGLGANRESFQQTYQSVFDQVKSARAASQVISNLLAEHQRSLLSRSVAAGSLVIDVGRSVDSELKEQFETFLNSANRALKGIQKLMEHFGIQIGFLFQKQQAFEVGIAALRKDHPELSAYLESSRKAWTEELQDLRNKMEHQGWTLPDVGHGVDNNGKIQMSGPLVCGRSVSHFCGFMTDRLCCFVEELCVYGFQNILPIWLGFEERPIAERSPTSFERFKLVTTQVQRRWVPIYHERRFEEV